MNSSHLWAILLIIGCNHTKICGGGGKNSKMSDPEASTSYQQLTPASTTFTPEQAKGIIECFSTNCFHKPHNKKERERLEGMKNNINKYLESKAMIRELERGFIKFARKNQFQDNEGGELAENAKQCIHDILTNTQHIETMFDDMLNRLGEVLKNDNSNTNGYIREDELKMSKRSKKTKKFKR